MLRAKENNFPSCSYSGVKGGHFANIHPEIKSFNNYMAFFWESGCRKENLSCKTTQKRKEVHSSSVCVALETIDNYRHLSIMLHLLY